MHTKFNALIRFSGNAKMFNTIAEFAGIEHIQLFDMGNTLGICLLELQGNTERNRSYDSKFVGRVDTFHIKSRIGLGITKCLCFFQNVVKVTPLVTHFTKNEITGAVNNTSYPFDFISSQAFAHSLDNRNTSGDRRFKSDSDTLFLCSTEYFIAMHSDQCLVCSDYMLAIFNGFEDQFFGRRVATY